MKPTEWRFWFGNGSGFSYSGVYTVARLHAIRLQIEYVGECSCYLGIVKAERKERGKWVEVENKGI